MVGCAEEEKKKEEKNRKGKKSKLIQLPDHYSIQDPQLLYTQPSRQETLTIFFFLLLGDD